MGSPRQKKKIRPEAVLGILALICAGLLLIMTVLCLPYFGEDPTEEVIKHHAEEETVPEEPDPSAPTFPPPEANPYGPNDFQYDGLFLKNLQTASIPGIDVSAHQGEIDWEKVKDSGVRFAMIRAGYRGYGKAGKLVEDKYAKENLEGAMAAGLDVGVYFFSQALNEEEIQEECDFLLDIIDDFTFPMPVVFDWEYISKEARTANMDADTLTALTLSFCRRMEAEGYDPMIYFNPNQGRTLLRLHELEEYPFWLAFYTDRMTYPHKVEMWQYTCTGRIPGIETDVDLNVFFPYI